MANQSDNKYGKIISQTLMSLISSVLEHNDKTKKKSWKFDNQLLSTTKFVCLKAKLVLSNTRDPTIVHKDENLEGQMPPYRMMAPRLRIPDQPRCIRAARCRRKGRSCSRMEMFPVVDRIEVLAAGSYPNLQQMVVLNSILARFLRSSWIS